MASLWSPITSLELVDGIRVAREKGEIASQTQHFCWCILAPWVWSFERVQSKSLSVFRRENLKFWEILNSKNFKYFYWNSFIFKILCLDKKIKIVSVKKNECKEKRTYDWCTSKEKNIDAASGVAGELVHDGIHHYTRLQHSVNGAMHGPGPPCRRTPPCVIGNDGCSPEWWVRFYASPYAHTRSTRCELRRCFL